MVKSAKPHVVAQRLDYLEQKVDDLKPGDAAVDSRIYNLTHTGAVIAAQDADWKKNTTVFEQAPSTSVAGTSLFKSIWGQQYGIGYWNIRTQTLPFYDQVFGQGGNYSQYLDDNTPLAAAIFPSGGKTYVAYVKTKLTSFFQACFGASQSSFDNWNTAPAAYAGNSLAGRQVNAEARIANLEADIVNLQNQINNLQRQMAAS